MIETKFTHQKCLHMRSGTSESGIYNTAKARFWNHRSCKSAEDLRSCSLFARKAGDQAAWPSPVAHIAFVSVIPQETLPEIEPKVTNGSNSHPKAGLSHFPHEGLRGAQEGNTFETCTAFHLEKDSSQGLNLALTVLFGPLTLSCLHILFA